MTRSTTKGARLAPPAPRKAVDQPEAYRLVDDLAQRVRAAQACRPRGGPVFVARPTLSLVVEPDGAAVILDATSEAEERMLLAGIVRRCEVREPVERALRLVSAGRRA